MEKNTKKNISGRALLIPFGIVLLLTSAINLVVGVRMADAYSRLEDTTSNSLQFRDASEQFQDGSDILTSNVRLFVATGKVQYLDGYFTEANVTKNRDTALEKIEDYDHTELTKPLLQEAMTHSTELMNVEYHAMKLTAVAFGTDVSNYTPVVNYNLAPEELSYTEEELLDAASNLVNGEAYHEIKQLIYNKIDAAFDVVIEKNQEIHNSLKTEMKNYVTIEVISTSIFTFLLLLAIFVTGHSLLFPMARAIKSISKDEPMDDTYGLSEYTTLATTYNTLLSRRNSLESELRNIANTDPLTGLPNRNAIAGIIESCGEKIFSKIAILSLDVNQLKETNDTKGHKTGDELLCNAADCILDFFGNDQRNNCCRIGGDEFTAFLMGLDESEVVAKIEAFNRAQLRYGVSIAVGYSYRDYGTVFDMRKMYEEADEKMYKSKKDYYKKRGLVHPSDVDPNVIN